MDLLHTLLFVVYVVAQFLKVLFQQFEYSVVDMQQIFTVSLNKANHPIRILDHASPVPNSDDKIQL